MCHIHVCRHEYGTLVQATLAIFSFARVNHSYELLQFSVLPTIYDNQNRSGKFYTNVVILRWHIINGKTGNKENGISDFKHSLQNNSYFSFGVGRKLEQSFILMLFRIHFLSFSCKQKQSEWWLCNVNEKGIIQLNIDDHLLFWLIEELCSHSL